MDKLELAEALSKLTALHQRLLGCFTSPTGVAPPRRPRSLQPTMDDCKAVLVGMIALERAKAELATLKAENDRLSNAVCSNVLGGLLDHDETEALVAFVKELRSPTALRARAEGGKS
jgi:hypothetical protein